MLRELANNKITNLFPPYHELARKGRFEENKLKKNFTYKLETPITKPSKLSSLTLMLPLLDKSDHNYFIANGWLVIPAKGFYFCPTKFPSRSSWILSFDVQLSKSAPLYFVIGPNLAKNPKTPGTIEFQLSSSLISVTRYLDDDRVEVHSSKGWQQDVQEIKAQRQPSNKEKEEEKKEEKPPAIPKKEKKVERDANLTSVQFLFNTTQCFGFFEEEEARSLIWVINDVVCFFFRDNNEKKVDEGLSIAAVPPDWQFGIKTEDHVDPHHFIKGMSIVEKQANIEDYLNIELMKHLENEQNKANANKETGDEKK